MSTPQRFGLRNTGKVWRRSLLLYAALLALSMVATRFQLVAPLALTSGVQPITGAFLAAAHNLQRAGEYLNGERDLGTRNAALKKQNDLLRQQSELLQREVARLRQVTQVMATQAPSVVGIAQVTEVDPSPLLSRLTINRGASAGLRVRMPVTVPAGLVGQVIEVSAANAVVLALADPESRVGVTLAQNKGGRGLAFGSPPDRIKAQFSLGVQVKPGDVLVTSSRGGVFPVGIRVGTVEKVFPIGPNDVNQTVLVKPAVDVNLVEDVTVLGGL